MKRTHTTGFFPAFNVSLMLAAMFLLAACGGQGNDTAQDTGTADYAARTADQPKGEVFPPEIVDFTPRYDTAVFAGTGEDTWDSKIRERGWIMREGGEWHMWYTGYNPGSDTTMKLGYATSPDGVTWTRWPDNPVFTDVWCEDMMVIKHGGIYYMAAEGKGDIAHLMSSIDRVHWAEHGPFNIRQTNGDALSPGPYGTPVLWFENDVWYLFYERNDSGIWLATSADMATWTNVSDDPVIACGPEPYDKEAVALNQIVRHRGRYYGWYHACATQPWSDWVTCVAVSDDLVHWTKYPGNPIVRGDKSSGILVPDGDGYLLYTMHPDVRVYEGAGGTL